MTRFLHVGLMLGLCVTLGCGAQLANGAQTIFSQATVCPVNRVTVTPRPDVAPHTILGGGAGTPPAEIASDPGRLQMWQNMNAQQTAAIDRSGKTYQVEGCGKRAMYVCNHPSQADVLVGNGLITGNPARRWATARPRARWC